MALTKVLARASSKSRICYRLTACRMLPIIALHFYN